MNSISIIEPVMYIVKIVEIKNEQGKIFVYLFFGRHIWDVAAVHGCLGLISPII